MSMAYPTLHQSQEALVQAGLHGLGNSSDALRRSISSQCTTASGSFKELSAHVSFVNHAPTFSRFPFASLFTFFLSLRVDCTKLIKKPLEKWERYSRNYKRFHYLRLHALPFILLCFVYKVSNAWEDELHNIVQMGLNSTAPLSSQDLSGMRSFPSDFLFWNHKGTNLSKGSSYCTCRISATWANESRTLTIFLAFAMLYSWITSL